MAAKAFRAASFEFILLLIITEDYFHSNSTMSSSDLNEHDSHCQEMTNVVLYFNDKCA